MSVTSREPSISTTRRPADSQIAWVRMATERPAGRITRTGLVREAGAFSSRTHTQPSVVWYADSGPSWAMWVVPARVTSCVRP